MSSETPPPKPNPDQTPVQQVDPRLQSFLRQAAPVIAAERGWNDGARVKLRAIAVDMKLPDEMFDQAIQMLQSEPPVVKRELSRYEAAFEKSMRAKLENIPRGILTGRIENRAVEVGTQKYQLTELQAREILRSLVGELKIQRISVTQSERHMESTIEELIGDGTFVSSEIRGRLVGFGKHWGMDEEHVEAMIRHYVELNLLNKQHGSRLVKILALALGVIVILVGFGVAYAILGRGGDAVTDNSKLDTDPEPELDRIRADFWDEDLEISAMFASQKSPEFKAFHKQLASADATVRQKAYHDLVAQLGKMETDEKLDQRLQKFFSKTIQLETSPENARLLVHDLVEGSIADITQLPITRSFLNRSRRNIDLLVQTQLDAKTASERAQIIANELFVVTGVTASGSDVNQIRRKYLEQIFQTQLNRLGGMVVQDTANTIASYSLVNDQSSDVLSDSKRSELGAVFIRTAIDAADGDQWKALAPIMLTTVKHAQTEQLVQLIEAFENSTNSPAQKFLRDLLVDTIGLPDATGTAEIAKAFRSKLGVAEPVRRGTAKKRTELIGQVRAFQAAIDWEESDLSSQADLIAAVAYWGTLASYVDVGNFESSEYQALVALGPPESLDDAYLGNLLQVPATEKNRTDREIPEGLDRSKLANSLKPIGEEFRKYNIQRHVSALKELAIIAKFIPDVPSETAWGFASYILSSKKDNEQDEVVAALPYVRHWPSLLAAIADQLSVSELQQDQTNKVVNVLLPEAIAREDKASWLLESRRELLKLSLERYREILPPADDAAVDQQFNLLQSAIKEFTRQRAINAGVSRNHIDSADNLRKILESWYRSIATEQQLSRLPFEQTSIEYVSRSDLQQTVLYQQLIIQRLAEIQGKKFLPNGDALERKLAELAQRYRSATNVYQQMMLNERMLLELFLREEE